MRDLEEVAALAVDCGLKLHRRLGPGMLESVYETILGAALTRAGLAVERQKATPIEYDGMHFQEGTSVPICWWRAG